MSNIYTQEEKGFHSKLVMDLLKLVKYRNKTVTYVFGWRQRICFFVRNSLNVILEDDKRAFKLTYIRAGKTFLKEYSKKEIHYNTLSYQTKYDFDMERMIELINITEKEMKQLDFLVIKGEPATEKYTVKILLPISQKRVKKVKELLKDNDISIDRVNKSNIHYKSKLFVIDEENKEKAIKCLEAKKFKLFEEKNKQ